MPLKEKRLMIIGDSGCGKTTILKVMECEVNPEVPTVYYKFLSGMWTAEKKKKAKKKKKKNSFVISFWDTPAFECSEWSNTREALYPGLDAAILVFSVDNKESLDNARYKWYPELRKCCHKKIPVILVGNKKDLRDTEGEDETIQYEEGLDVAEKIKAYAYVECSALHDDDTLNAFTFAVQSVLKKSHFCSIM